MYDRYTISSSRESLEKAFGVKMPETYTPNFNAVPTQQLPVVTAADNQNCKLCHWGLPAKLSNNKTISSKLYNLPAASAFQRPVYRKLIEKKRCVILADGFYIWKPLSKKQKAPYFCYFNNRVPFGIAGIWEEYEDIDGHIFENFNMLTVPATHEPRNYQEDIPAILKVDAALDWLNQELPLQKVEDIIKNVTAQGLVLHAVSPVLANSKINDERLIKPSTPSDQFGNYTLFS